MLLTFAAPHCRAQSPTIKKDDAATSRVLVVHSYHDDYEWTQSVQEGLELGFKDKPVTMKVFYMDTKRNPSQKEIQQAGQKATQIEKDWNPDIVLASDDNAQKYFAQKLAGTHNAPAVVFCGVNADPEDYGYPAENVTGVLERPHIKESLTLLLRICPNVKNIAVLTDDSKTSSEHIKQMKSLDLPIKVAKYYQPSTLEEWKTALAEIQKDNNAIALYSWHTVKDNNGHVVNPHKIIKWTQENNSLPSTGFMAYNNTLCCVSHSGTEQGYAASQMTLQIMQGAKPKDIPIKVNLRGQVLFNLDIAEKLNIDIPYEILRLGQYKGEIE
jgi:ABC-type uncharacterized transport system substrate-binding protein